MPFTQTPPAFTWDNLNNTWATLFNTWMGRFDPVVEVFLGTDSPVEITEQTFSLSTSRGRNRDLQRTNAGTMGVSLRNETRIFDPKADSPIQSVLRPRVPVTVKVDGQNIFAGVVNDWDFEYDVGGQSIASMNCADGFTLFAQETVAGTAVVQDAGDRFNDALDNLRIPWPSDKRQIDVGQTRMASGEYQSNALQYFQQLEESEGGLIFMTKDNEFAFQQRLLQPEEDVIEFTDTGAGISYENIEITFGTDLLANDVRVSSVAGVGAAVDVDSRIENGVAELSLDTLLAGGSLQGLADYLLSRYGRPEYRIAAVTINLRAFDAAERARILELELGSQANVFFTPNKVGDPIVARSRITGISHNIEIDSHRITFNFEEIGGPFFILDDDDAGKLDNTEFTLGT